MHGNENVKHFFTLQGLNTKQTRENVQKENSLLSELMNATSQN